MAHYDERRRKAQGELLAAAYSGDSQIVRNALGSLGSMDVVDAFTFRTIIYKALQFAVQDDRLHSVTLLLDSLDKYGLVEGDHWRLIFLMGHQGMISSPVFAAVEAGHLEVVRKLISYLGLHSQWKELAIAPIPKSKTTQSFDAKCRFQELVQWAVRWGHVSIVEFLVAEYQCLFGLHADIMALNLHLAAYHGHLDVFKMILQCKYCSENEKLSMPLDLPCTRAQQDMEQACLPAMATIPPSMLPPSCLQELASPSNLLSSTITDSTRGHSSCHWEHPPEVEVVAMAPEASSFSKDGLTALHLAAQSGFFTAVKLLTHIAKSNGTEVSEPELFTPLHLAASSGHVEVVNFLLTRFDGIILKRDCLGRTALHYAAREGHVHVVQALVNANHDIALAPDYDGLLALHMAARAGHVEVITALNPFGGIMCKAKHSIEVISWVEREYELEGGDYMDLGSLTFCPGKKWRFPRVKLFDSLFWRTKGFTPLHFAARYGYGAAVEELLKNRDLIKNVGEGSGALVLQDSGGFLAYDWMKVHEQQNAFLRFCVAGGCNSDVDLMKEELENTGLSSKITSDMRLSIASDIHEEKEAMKEVQRAWQSGIGIEHLHIGMPVLQWLLEDEQVAGPGAAWQELPLSIKPYRLRELLDQALEKCNFKAAKHILLQYAGADLRSDAARLASRVKQTLNSKTLAFNSFKSSRFKRSLEDFLIVLVTREELPVDASKLSWLAVWAGKNGLTSLSVVVVNRPALRQAIYNDRQPFLDCANVILVGAALIAGVAFQGWLQPPLGYSYEYQGSEYADVHESAARIFWWFNNGSFFFAVLSLIAGAKGAVPLPGQHWLGIMASLEKLRRAVAVASVFLGMALLCVIGAFSAAGFAVLPPLDSDLRIMQTCVGLGTTLCGFAMLWFSVGIFPLLSHTIPDGIRKGLSFLYVTWRRVVTSICPHWSS